MFRSATRVLRLHLGTAAPPAEVTEEAPRIDFVAYTGDCALSGSLTLTADRLTDLLNDSEELELSDVLRLGFDGRITEESQAVLARNELFAVKAGSPRGNPARRQRTRQIGVVAGVGEFAVHGYLHGRPGTDPMIHAGRRPPMIPLTDASIAYRTADRWSLEDADTLIINRDLTDWMRAAREDEMARARAGWGAA